MTPARLYSDKDEVNQDFAELRWRWWVAGVEGSCWRSAVAKCAMRKKSQRLEGMWKLKSTNACTRNPAQATIPESCKAPTKEKSFWRKREKELSNKATKNQAQHKPPSMPVSARGARESVYAALTSLP